MDIDSERRCSGNAALGSCRCSKSAGCSVSEAAFALLGPRMQRERHTTSKGQLEKEDNNVHSPWEQRLVRSPSRASPTITLLSRMNVTTSTSYSCNITTEAT